MGKLTFTLQGVPATFDEFDEVVKYNMDKPDRQASQKYVDAAKKILDKAPKPRNDRERAIYDSGYKVGFVAAMADKKLWWRSEQAKLRPRAASSRKANTEHHHRVLARQYKVLRRSVSDISARKKLQAKHGHDLSYLTKILKAQNAL